MEDHNSPEAVAQRASQEDPIVMYLVVRESLNMSIGKTGAQCGHAAQIVLLKYFEMKDKLHSIQNQMDYRNWEECDRLEDERDKLAAPLAIFREWLGDSFRKVTLKADEKEWKKVKEAFVEGVYRFTVIDAGLTEIAAGSETVIGIWPMRKSQRPKILTKLQVLK